MSTALLPDEGPLAALRGEVEVLAEPGSPRRPWVVAKGDRVFKAYDLAHFDATDRARLLAEAETALALREIDGVVTTHGFAIEDGWLVIEMERLGESLGEYLEGVAAGTRQALELARWGVLFEAVARTLDEVHRSRRLHRDVKPDNLIFDREGTRLVVVDFSIAMRRPRGGGEGKAGLAGTRRYIAPEVMRGRIGPAADQYGLAVTAGDALGKEIPPAGKAVLLRATEQNPEDRYGSIADFGMALRSVLDDAAPRRVSSRLQRVSVRWRQTWAVAATVFAGTYAVLLWRRSATLGWEDGIVFPLLAAALAVLVSWMLYPLRGGRSRPHLAIADRGWFSALLFGLAMAAFAPLLADNPSKNAAKLILPAAVGALALSAALGSVRRDAGERLINIVRRWERWREGQRRRPSRWWGVRLLILAGLALIAILPPAIAHRWPRDGASEPSEIAPIAIVAQLRSAVLSERWAEACRLTRVPTEPGKAPCERWVRLVGEWTKDDMSVGAPRFGFEQLADLRLTGTEDIGLEPTWRIRESAGESLDVGLLNRETEDGRIWDVTVNRRPPSDGDPFAISDKVWRYEVALKAGRWWITAVEICDYNAARACLRVTQLDSSALPDIAKHGPPVATGS